MTAAGRRAAEWPLTMLLARGLPAMNRAVAASGRPFTAPGVLVPHTARRGRAWSHNGVMIPDLPEPLRFLSATTFAGTPGTQVSDSHTPPPPGGPRNRATAQLSTAASAPGFWREYAIDAECEFREDGTLWRFGENLVIAGGYPDYTVTIDAGGLRADLRLTCTGAVSWFVRTPLYHHLSLLARYTGTIAAAGRQHQVAGLCTLEHATAVSGHTLTGTPLPKALQMPLDFFTYQVLDLGGGAQLLLVATEANGRRVLDTAHLRDTSGRSVALDRGVVFEVLEYQSPPATTPDGASMALPRRFRWTTPADSAVPLDVEGTVDTPFNWGLGNGYVGGFSVQGTVDGRACDSPAGYVEYIDRRA